MRLSLVLMAALAAPLPLAAPAHAEVPAWLSGEWRTSARLTAPDGARLRIRCTMNATAPSASDWNGTLGCATVQGRFAGQWQIALEGVAAQGTVVFSGLEDAELDVSGTLDAARMDLTAGEGQGVAFAPGPDGALIVEMTAMGPQRLTGTLTFESR